MSTKCLPYFRGTVEPLYSGRHWGMRFCPLNEGVALSQGLICTKRVHLGLSKVAFIEGCPHIRGGLYRGVSSHQGWPL